MSIVSISLYRPLNSEPSAVKRLLNNRPHQKSKQVKLIFMEVSESLQPWQSSHPVNNIIQVAYGFMAAGNLQCNLDYS